MIKWKIDTQHSEIQFKVKHMLISTVTGMFTKFDGFANTVDEHNFVDAEVELTIAAASVYTNEEYRDEHLKSEAFFNIKQFPAITFKSTTLRKSKNKNTFILTGLLSIRAITQTVELKIIFGGVAHYEGNQKAGFEVLGSINRRDFDLSYNPLMEAGGMVVSEEVEIKANIELIKL